MKTIVDTSSLVRMAQSYWPFDHTGALEAFLRSELERGELLLIDAVAAECKYVSQGIALDTFNCLQNKAWQISTVNLQPPQKFYRMLDNNFVDQVYKKTKLQGDEVLYQNAREEYLRSTDCRIVVYAMCELAREPIQVLTEESANQNDGKLFRKIPFICQQLGIPTLNAVEYFKQHEDALTVVVESTPANMYVTHNQRP